MYTNLLDRTHDCVGALDVAAYDDRYEVLVDVPGVRPADLEVTMVGDQLLIRGVRRHGLQADDVAQANHRFERRLTLAGKLDRDAIVADLHNGVLRIAVPRISLERRRIAIGTGRPAIRSAHGRERIRLPWQAPARKTRRRLSSGARQLMKRAWRR
ncbi:MAG: Hsp20/alpha crystallin family protein [Solirubrobacterales bacterium]|nr:Hsp20/alpha crystallin family protein [Solirubrobacterales bacterium]